MIQSMFEFKCHHCDAEGVVGAGKCSKGAAWAGVLSSKRMIALVSEFVTIYFLMGLVMKLRPTVVLKAIR